MDKNTGLYIVFGFLLLCILLSLDKKEGFLVIREDLFETACAEGHESCNVIITGLTGVECTDPPNKDNYTFPSGANNTISGDSFNMVPTDCNDVSAFHTIDGVAPTVQQCTGAGDYILSGCSSKCRMPSALPDGYTTPPGGPSPPQYILPNELNSINDDSITCAEGYTRAINTCFNKENGRITMDRESACRSDASLIWFGGHDNIKTFCSIEGAEYDIYGCEPLCLSRIDNTSDYLLVGEAPSNDDYNNHKERIEIDISRPNPALESSSNVLQSFPYSEGYSTFDPNNFSVNLSANSGWTFADPGNNVVACDIKNPDENIRRNYYVKGLYPVCDADDNVECLNFNIVYSDEEDVPTTLEDFKNDPNGLPIENIFEEGRVPNNIEDYKKALYYFRRFKNEEGLDEIEAQIRCDRNDDSEYHCRIVEQDLANEYCETLPQIGGVGDGCNGRNRTKKTHEEISTIPSEQIQEARDAGEGDNKFRSPCCKWHNIDYVNAEIRAHSNTGETLYTDTTIPDILPNTGLTDYLNTQHTCDIVGGSMPWFSDPGEITGIPYKCIPLTITVEDNSQGGGGSATISMIKGRVGSAGTGDGHSCASTGTHGQSECICPQNDDGDFMSLAYADEHWNRSPGVSQGRHTRCV